MINQRFEILDSAGLIGIQSYRVESRPAGFDIWSIGNYADADGSRLTSTVRLARGRYLSAEFHVHRGNRSMNLTVDVSGDDGVVLGVDGRRQVLGNKNCGHRPLLDISNPFVEFANAVMVLGILDGEEIETPVYAVDLLAGSLIPATYVYVRHGTEIHVRKGMNPCSDSLLTLHEESFRVVEYRSAGHTYRIIDEQ